jgi:peptidoglycan/LPS O-acetylase OafA/YrhL
MNPSSRHIVFIDYLRGIAIISVFLYHCLASAYGVTALPWNWLHRSFMAPGSFIALLPIHFGFLGVPMFFVISGFCIHLSFKQQGQEWVSFFIRRFFRLYPAYLAVLVIFLLFEARDLRGCWLQFKYHALLIHNYNQGTFYTVNGSFWSIAVEVQLYLIYPLLLWLVGKFGWKKTLAGLAACEIFLDLWDDVLYQFTAYSDWISPFLLLKVTPFINLYLKPSPLAFWFSWSLGAYVADAFLQGRRFPLAKSSTAFWGFLIIVSYFTAVFACLFFLLCAVLTTKILSEYLTSSGLDSKAPNFWLRLLRRIGLYSYSIYLLHQPLLDWTGKALTNGFPHMGKLAVFFSCVSMSVVVVPLAGLCYRFIEQPGIALGKKILKGLNDTP